MTIPEQIKYTVTIKGYQQPNNKLTTVNDMLDWRLSLMDQLDNNENVMERIWLHNEIEAVDFVLNKMSNE